MNILGTGFTYRAAYFSPAGELVWVEDVHNIIPQQGVDYFAGLIRNTVSIVPSWYVGVFENDYTPVAGTTASQLVSVIGETVAYQDATRPEWISAYNDVSRLDNSANRAELVFTSDRRIYGGFLVSNSTKQDTSGTLLSIARFSNPKDVEAGGTLRVLAGVDLVATV